MTPCCFDFETLTFSPGFMAPPPVCASIYHPQHGAQLFSTSELPALLERVLDDPAPLLMHGGAYDSCCWLEWYPELRRKLFAKYDADAVLDTIETERLIEIATGDRRGRLALDLMAQRYGVTVVKSYVRTDFGRYYQRPLSEYSPEHVRYACGDTAELHTMHERQEARGLVSRRDVADLCRGSFWLRLSANWGVRTDPARVVDLERTTQAEIDVLTEFAQQCGFMRGDITTGAGRPKDPSKWFSRDTKAILRRVLEAYGPRNVPRTDSWDPEDSRADRTSADFDEIWAVSRASLVLDESGDFDLETLSELGKLLAVRNKDLVMLRDGVAFPIHTRYGWAATTRTTSSKPNMQNFRKKRGIRECLAPRAGNVFVETDYPSVELFAVGQICKWRLGLTGLLERMNRGEDEHAHIAAKILGIPYEQVLKEAKTDPRVKNARDCGKYGNYGLLGYMTNPATFARYVNMGSRTEENPRGLQWPDEKADEVMRTWRKTATDQMAYLKSVDKLRNRLDLYDVELPGTSIMRRGCLRSVAANTGFQSLAAKLARMAGWLMAKRQYVEYTMPSHTALFTHDAFTGECKEADVDEVAAAQEECMAEAMTIVMPDCSIWPASRGPKKNVAIVSSDAMRHYTKFAKSGRDDRGRLEVCDV